MKLGKEEENKLLIFFMVFSFLMQCHKRKLKAVQGRKMEKTEDRTKKHDIKNQNEGRHNRSLKYMKKKLIENKDQKIIIVLYIKTRSAVTRIRTWVIAATTQCTNHYTITAATAAHRCFQVKIFIVFHIISKKKNQHSSRAPR